MAAVEERKVHFDNTVFVGYAPQYDRKIRVKSGNGDRNLTYFKAQWLSLTVKDKLRIRAEMNLYKCNGFDFMNREYSSLAMPRKCFIGQSST